MMVKELVLIYKGVNEVNATCGIDIISLAIKTSSFITRRIKLSISYFIRSIYYYFYYIFTSLRTYSY